jgi:hypothetical protein
LDCKPEAQNPNVRKWLANRNTLLQSYVFSEDLGTQARRHDPTAGEKGSNAAAKPRRLQDQPQAAQINKQTGQKLQFFQAQSVANHLPKDTQQTGGNQ